MIAIAVDDEALMLRALVRAISVSPDVTGVLLSAKTKVSDVSTTVESASTVEISFFEFFFIIRNSFKILFNIKVFQYLT